jgi:hypothetical protein
MVLLRTVGKLLRQLARNGCRSELRLDNCRYAFWNQLHRCPPGNVIEMNKTLRLSKQSLTFINYIRPQLLVKGCVMLRYMAPFLKARAFQKLEQPLFQVRELLETDAIRVLGRP